MFLHLCPSMIGSEIANAVLSFSSLATPIQTHKYMSTRFIPLMKQVLQLFMYDVLVNIVVQYIQ